MKTHKSLFQILLSALLLSGIVFSSGCDSGTDPKTQKEKTLEMLTAKSWNIKSVTADGVDVTAKFKGLNLSFNETSFTATNGAALWQATDTWSFTSETAAAFIRGDNVEVEIVELTAQSLILTLQWEKNIFGAGRAYATSGSYTFVFE